MTGPKVVSLTERRALKEAEANAERIADEFARHLCTTDDSGLYEKAKAVILAHERAKRAKMAEMKRKIKPDE